MSWTVVAPAPSELGESPFWHPHEQSLYWVDIAGKKILRCNVFMGEVETWVMPSEPGCIAPAATGGLVIALRDGVYRAATWGGPLRLLHRFAHDPASTRFNDGKADVHGRFWAGTMFEPRTTPAAELFALDCRSGTAVAQRMAGGATIANGLAWSPDHQTLYWGDTTTATIRAWDWDADANLMRRERVFAQFPEKPICWLPGQPGYAGRPDGASVDAAGNYWVAMYEGGQVLQLSPQGQVLANFEVPAQCPTMPCFGGDDLKTLYLTSARQGRPADELKALPQSGCVFSMRVDVPGLPVNFFQD